MYSRCLSAASYPGFNPMKLSRRYGESVPACTLLHPSTTDIRLSLSQGPTDVLSLAFMTSAGDEDTVCGTSHPVQRSCVHRVQNSCHMQRYCITEVPLRFRHLKPHSRIRLSSILLPLLGGTEFPVLPVLTQGFSSKATMESLTVTLVVASRFETARLDWPVVGKTLRAVEPACLNSKSILMLDSCAPAQLPLNSFGMLNSMAAEGRRRFCHTLSIWPSFSVPLSPALLLSSTSTSIT